ncbi:hypothetical protein KAH37_03505 [bacterium]|nr:hypothetical protein [bacterium]
MKPSDALKKFEIVNIEYDFSHLPKDIQKTLPHLRKAMDKMTDIFLRQQSEALPAHYQEVMAGSDEERKKFYHLFRGPYSQLENFISSYDDVDNRRAGCAFYPVEMSDEEIKEAIEKAPAALKEELLDHYSVVRRVDGNLVPIPYHIQYAEELSIIFDELQAAADETEDEALREYLIHRAEGMVTGEYRSGDADWVRLTDSAIDPVMGPFEVYADDLFGVKATYEAMLMIVDKERGAQLKEIEGNLDKLAAIFPVPEGSKSAVGGIAPMEVVHQVYSAGEASQGIMASAFNLPNDPWVRGNVGWKQVMIYNIMQAKFNHCTVKIADKISNGTIQASFEPYFYFVLLHEVSHGLGPAYRADGRSVAKCIGTAYTAVEEAKADTGSLHLMLHLNGKHGIPAIEKQALFDSYFAGLFRSMRFGVHEAHGAANVIQFNWFKEHGIINGDSKIGFRTNTETLVEITEKLLNTLCNIEANQTPEEAEQFVKKYANPGADITEALETLEDIPIDIAVVYPTF